MANMFLFLSVFFSISLFLLEKLRVGSLNVNGMRDKRKAETIIEFIRLKNLNVTLAGDS